MADRGHKTRTCLWFASGGLEATQDDVALISGSEIERSVGPADAPVMVNFSLAGTPYQILNGGDHHCLTPASSISVLTEDQAETDRFGLSWQSVPRRLTELMAHDDPAVVARVNEAMMQMTKIDVAAFEAAALG